MLLASPFLPTPHLAHFCRETAKDFFRHDTQRRRKRRVRDTRTPHASQAQGPLTRRTSSAIEHAMWRGGSDRRSDGPHPAAPSTSPSGGAENSEPSSAGTRHEEGQFATLRTNMVRAPFQDHCALTGLNHEAHNRRTVPQSGSQGPCACADAHAGGARKLAHAGTGPPSLVSGGHGRRPFRYIAHD